MKKFLQLSLSFLFCLIVNPAYADTPGYAKTKYILVDGEPIRLRDGLDLSGKDLRGVEIHSELKPLRNINFSHCHLENANLEEALFVSCDFTGAYLQGSKIDGISEDTKVTGATINHSRIRLTPKALKTTDSYTSGNLQGCYLGNRDYTGFSFRNCVLSHAIFAGARMKGCDLTDARIKGCYFYIVFDILVDFSDDKNFPNKEWADKKFRESREFGLSIEQLLVTKDFKDGEVVDVLFNKIDWPDRVVDLSNMVFVNCNLGWSDTSAKIDLTDSVISKCNFEYFHGLTLENVKSTWNYKHNRMEGIKLPEEIQKALDAEKKK